MTKKKYGLTDEHRALLAEATARAERAEAEADHLNRLVIRALTDRDAALAACAEMRAALERSNNAHQAALYEQDFERDAERDAEVIALRGKLADEHAKRCAAEVDQAGAVADYYRAIRECADANRKWVAAVARAEKAEAERDAVLADFSRELDDARKQITERVMEWARKSGCVYCDEVFDTLGPEGAGDARRALYVAHTKVCIKHPLRQAEAACAEMRAALEEIVTRGAEQRGTGRMIEAAEAVLSRTDLGRDVVVVPREVVERVRDVLIELAPTCRCDEAWTSRGRHEVNALCHMADDAKAAIADLDALLKKGGG